jgi:hypothetical protein
MKTLRQVIEAARADLEAAIARRDATAIAFARRRLKQLTTELRRNSEEAF